jgi:hypothetical protein
MVAADPVPARAAGGFGDIMAWRRIAIGRRGRGRRHLGHRAAAGRTDRCPAEGALPAVGNALVDALKPLGIRDLPMPASPERLWRAIRAAGC